jgi:hypothetical protein
VSISTHPLSPPDVDRVLELASAAASADGVAPLSEDVLLQVRHGSTPPARDIEVAASPAERDQVMVGYAHIDARPRRPDLGAR